MTMITLALIIFVKSIVKKNRLILMSSELVEN
jgi:hypothetical protein